jgi:hypothetical protein
MLGATSSVIALMSWTLHANGATTIAKRTDNQIDDVRTLIKELCRRHINERSSETRKNTLSALPLTQDHDGGLLYGTGFLYIITVGQVGEQAFVGI